MEVGGCRFEQMYLDCWYFVLKYVTNKLTYVSYPHISTILKDLIFKLMVKLLTSVIISNQKQS